MAQVAQAEGTRQARHTRLESNEIEKNRCQTMTDTVDALVKLLRTACTLSDWAAQEVAAIARRELPALTTKLREAPCLISGNNEFGDGQLERVRAVQSGAAGNRVCAGTAANHNEL